MRLVPICPHLTLKVGKGSPVSVLLASPPPGLCPRVLAGQVQGGSGFLSMEMKVFRAGDSWNSNKLPLKKNF